MTMERADMEAFVAQLDEDELIVLEQCVLRRVSQLRTLDASK
jgi:hypothetical protein